MWHPFASQRNFLDPLLTSDGKPYAPEAFRRIVQECYLLTKNLHTSYTDILRITPTERHYLLQFLFEDAQKNKEYLEKIHSKQINK